VNRQDKNLNSKIGKAIAQAQKVAPEDDSAFLLQLRAGVVSQTKQQRVRALSVQSRKAKGARLADDPRYLANIRALVKQKPNERIVGGSAVEGTEFNDCVAVGDDDQFGCTGTLIAPNVVLTAAHCEALHTRVFIGNSLSKKGREFRVRKHVRHAKFDGALRNDLMILILEKKVTGVKPRGLASSALINAATTARVVGFGTTDVHAAQGFGVKRKTDVPIVSQGCRGTVNGRSDAAVYGCHRDREIVAGKPLFLHDTCKGDSGGPFFIRDAKGRWLLAGVTSRGTDLALTMCGDGGLYVRVDAYAKWIASALKEA
jgi:secreted trypsin-like serine protease